MARLTPALVVETSIAMIAENGSDSFSMRALATRLGVTPMALYHHFDDRDAVLIAVLDEVSTSMERPAPTADPRGDAVAAALALHQFLVNNPWTVRLISTGRLSGAAGLWFPETILDAGRHAGLDDGPTFVFYRTVFALVIGQATFTVSREAAKPGRSAIQRADQTSMPLLTSLASRWPQLDELATPRSIFTAAIFGLLPGPPEPSPLLSTPADNQTSAE